MNGFLFTDKLSDIDLDLNELSQLEAERQARRLIMIPSESIAPKAVRQLLGSPLSTFMQRATRERKRARKLRLKS